MAWYDNENDLTHIATYKNEREASDEANRAARKGWLPQGTSATDGHVNVGRTTLKVLALGLPFLVTGASRSKGRLTITYVRTAEWLAQHNDAAPVANPRSDRGARRVRRVAVASAGAELFGPAASSHGRGEKAEGDDADAAEDDLADDEGQSAAPGLLRDVPGYRSGELRSGILATLLYVTLGLMFFAGVITNSAEALLSLALIGAFLLAADGWHVRSRLPLFRDQGTGGPLAGWVIVGLAILLLANAAATNGSSARPSSAAASAMANPARSEAPALSPAAAAPAGTLAPWQHLRSVASGGNNLEAASWAKAFCCSAGLNGKLWIELAPAAGGDAAGDALIAYRRSVAQVTGWIVLPADGITQWKSESAQSQTNYLTALLNATHQPPMLVTGPLDYYPNAAVRYLVVTEDGTPLATAVYDSAARTNTVHIGP